jgi:hypothetical protein
MPGHTKTIYSRRQRRAPGQYDTPLADFLDRLPDYVNQFQQNQLAIGRQKLQEQRYQDSIARQNRLDVENQKRYETSQALAAKAVEESNKRFKIQQENIDINRKRADDQFIKTNVMSLVRSGKYGLAEQMLTGLEGPEIESLGAVIRQERDSKEELDSAFKDVRNLYYDPNVSVYEKQDRLNSFQEKYSDRFELGKGIDDSITRFISAVNLKAATQNRGFKPLSEWPTSGPDGQRDLDEYNRIKKQIDEDTEQLASATGPVLRTGMDLESFVKGIDEKKDQLKILESKYATETRDQYNERKAKRQKLGDAAARGITLPNLGFGQKTLEFIPSSEESLADIDLENRTDKMLQNLTSDPDESDQGGTVLPRIIPQAQAGQGNINTEPARDDTLDIEKISTAPAGNFDVKDITLEKGRKSNPRVAQSYAGDIQKLNNLMLRLDTADQTANPDFTKGRLNKSIKSIAEKIKKEYGDFIDPNTGEFIDKSFSSDFFSVLSRSTNLSDSRLKQLFKSLSTAKPVQQAI